MDSIHVHAQRLVYLLMSLMPTAYQRDSLQTLLGLFLDANGKPLPQYSTLKSPSALSRFLNHYDWPTRRVIRHLRRSIVERLLAYCPKGRRPELQLIVDLTSLEKTGKFNAFAHLIHVLQGKRGLHVVVLYLVVGHFRVPWGFRVWRGKGTPSSAYLAIRLIDTLPQALRDAFRLRCLADTAFGSITFLKAMKKRHIPLIVGLSAARTLADGRQVRQLVRRGQRVRLHGVPFDVSISWVYLKRNGTGEKRFVLSTRPLKGSTIAWWGRRRWSIEGFFKTTKHRFGLSRFGQQSLKGVYRWLLLCLISFLLAHWAYLSTGNSALPDWGAAARLALERFFAEVVVCTFWAEVVRTRPLLHAMGVDIQLVPI